MFIAAVRAFPLEEPPAQQVRVAADEEFLERLFALAEEGRTDERGTPEPEALRELMTEFRREIAPARSD